MTTARFAIALAVLTIVLGCSDDAQLNTDAGASQSGGSGGAASGGATSTDGTQAASAAGTSSGGSAASATDNGTQSTATGGSTSVAAAVTTRCAAATSGEVTLTHTPSTGQTESLAGTTTITAGSATSFDASSVDLKFCFGVVGDTTFTIVSAMAVYSASISGGSLNYIDIAGTALSVETTAENNRYCIVFDVGSVAATAGVSVTGDAAVTYNWNFTKRSVDTGLMFDPRAKNAPELIAVLNGTDAACQVVSS